MASHGDVDKDPSETNEWLESLDGLIEEGGESRAEYVLERMVEHASTKQPVRPLESQHPVRQHDSR
ncbi:hypothetical protein GCM10025876_03170 [Demequina litorisediminis]|uniref:Pyruvate dehydrogenase E1 component n=1 Tax=Demequina litorisediminis TaxID=1849022 RepID=A0ABQ6IBJ2_9MICO|nr:hypothetical protein GCM10025876_03170 [Demequina litorisediminis]